MLIAATDPPIGVPVPQNDPPQWSATPVPTWTATVGGTYSLASDAFDPNADTLTYSVVSGSLPTGVSLNTSTGLLTATTGVLQGNTALVFGVNDGIAATVNSPSVTMTIIAAPPPGGGVKWHPGHYLKQQGKPTQVDQAAWQAKILQDLDTYVNDDVLILGAHVGFGWGALNPTGSTYNWSIVYAVLDWMVANNKYLLAQIQSKNFSTSKGLEAPADLAAQIIPTNTGWTAALWRNGTAGFPDVMARYITFWQAFIAEFDSHPNLEIFVPTESSPSLGSAAPGDYSSGQYGDELRRMYNAIAPDAVKTNIAANINNLGTNAADEVPSLLETAYQLGMIHATPDAKETVGYKARRQEQTYTVPVTRDYRSIMGFLTVYSNDVAVQGGGTLPHAVIEAEQLHKTTHLSWIPPNTISSQWDPGTNSILDAINADPLLTSTCPDKYSSCEV